MSFPLGVWQALLAAIYVADKIALGEHEFVPTSRLAADLAIPAPSLSRLLRDLGRAGIVESREGAQGGVRLALPPDRVSLLAVVEAVDQMPALFRTDAAPAATGETPDRRLGALRHALGEAEAAMRASLEAVTLADITRS